MNRTNSAALAALLAAFALTACQLKPGGQCGSQSDCETGRLCLDGVCVLPAPGGASCTKDLECAPWATCQSSICVMDEGRCSVDKDCPDWKYCDPTEVPGDNPGDPPKFEAYSCRVEPDRCDSSFDCVGHETWSTCDLSTNWCRPGEGHCVVQADCQKWETCDPAAHDCLLNAGRCGTIADCEEWEVCTVDNYCNVAPSRCASDANCQTPWQQCVLDTHLCGTAPGYCASDAECQQWERCGTAHTCELAPGACATDADCMSPAACVAHACATRALVSSAVYLLGTLQEGSSEYDAFCALDQPTRPAVGFKGYNGGYISAAGELVYDTGRNAMARFFPDKFEWDAFLNEWTIPSTPEANDPTTSFAGCETASTTQWLVKPSGAIVHACGASWLDASGAVLWTPPQYYGRAVAWNDGDAKLVENVSDLYVYDAAGNAQLVSGITWNTYTSYVARKARDSGFWVVVEDANADTDTLYLVDATGKASVVGAYPPRPMSPLGQPLVTNGRWVLDGTGAMFEFASEQAGSTTYVVKRTITPSTSTIVYDESLGTNDWKAGTWYVRIYGSDLVTGP